MAINFTRMFTAIGKIIGGLNETTAFQGTTLATRANTLSAQYVSPDNNLVNSLFSQLQSTQNAQSPWVSYLQSLAQATMIQECSLDRPLNNNSVASALAAVAYGLRAAGQTVTESPATLATVPSLTVGNGQLVFAASVNPSDLYLADSYLLNVTSDQTTGATQYQESISMVGKANVGALNWLWPQGSSVNTTLRAIDSAQTTKVPPSFATWTPFGTTAVASAGTGPRSADTTYVPYTITGNGSYFQYQLPTTLAPGTFSYNLFMKGNAGNTFASVVTVSIVNASGTLISTLATLSATSGSWVQSSGVWNFPIQPPVTPSTGYYLRFTVVTGGTATVTVAYPGFVSLSPLYQGGPVACVWSGTTAFGLADLWTASTTRGTSETVSLIRGMERLFTLSAYSPYIVIPTGNPGDYTDALVV